ncbi:MAG: helix-turn-helix transcriptional regulator [Candidatus Latescibacteria bacterium]|nr:helix-turn-helix transcriptional regulator [Candidatus Latescibacterota bacterium]
MGTRIKILRIQNDPDQTQAEFGAKLGFSGNMISKIERGRSEPTMKFLLRLSELTGTRRKPNHLSIRGTSRISSRGI